VVVCATCTPGGVGEGVVPVPGNGVVDEMTLFTFAVCCALAALGDCTAWPPCVPVAGGVGRGASGVSSLLIASARLVVTGAIGTGVVGLPVVPVGRGTSVPTGLFPAVLLVRPDWYCKTVLATRSRLALRSLRVSGGLPVIAERNRCDSRLTPLF